MATKAKTFKTTDIMHDFKALAAAQIYAGKLTAAHDMDKAAHDSAVDVLAFTCAHKCLDSYQKLMATIRIRFGQESYDALTAYYIEGDPGTVIASKYGIEASNYKHHFERWIIAAYKVRERVPFPAFPIGDEEKMKENASLLIQEARHYDYYITKKDALYQKLYTISHQFEPKSPSLSNEGGAIVHDPARVEKAMLDAIDKKDALTKQIAYCTAMIEWIDGCVANMEPLWQMAFIPYCQNAISTGALCDSANLSEYEIRRSFYINGSGVLNEQRKADYRNIRHKYQDVLSY